MRTSAIASALLAAAILAMPAFTPLAPAQVREDHVKTTEGPKKPITDFGAVDDGKTMNTEAIQKGIDTLASSGGGTLVVPKGTFLTGALFFKPGVNLEVDKDGVLKGSTDLKDFPERQTRIEGHFQQWVPAMINADHCDHFRLTGEGTLDGSGQVYWNAFRTAQRATRGTKNLDVPRPRLTFISNSDDVQVKGLHYLNSGFWNLHLYHCQDVLVDGIDIHAGDGSPSTDGIDVDSCQYVTIKGITVYNNDDGIAIKGTKGPFAMRDKEKEESPADEHILIEDSTFLKSGSIMTCGSEASIVKDVTVQNCKITGDKAGGISVVRLKLRTDTPQEYSDIHVKNITLDGGGTIINIAPWSQYFDLMGQPQPTRKIDGVTIEDVHGKGAAFGSVAPGPGDTITNLTFKNIDVEVPSPRGLPRFRGATNLTFDNVKINGQPYNGPAPAPAPAAQ
ncbi:MAG TPA: glycosyl hydrolase family 28 protein [Phycisphaerae bacterium]|nr:glycosyl hydrolase family 28 protein [Phycisphaerae bacterium]